MSNGRYNYDKLMKEKPKPPKGGEEQLPFDHCKDCDRGILERLSPERKALLREIDRIRYGNCLLILRHGEPVMLKNIENDIKLTPPGK